MVLTKPWLWISITGRESLADYEHSLPELIIYAKPRIAGIILVGSSWQEAERLPCSSVVLAVVAECTLHNIPFMWGRHLWITHSKLAPTHPQTPLDAGSAIYYAIAMQAVVTEAMGLGARSSLLDAEPYGDSPIVEIKEGVTISADLRCTMAGAIKEATTRVSQPEFVSPGYHRLPEHWRWPMSLIGRKVLSRTTYRARTWNDPATVPNPPTGYSYSLTHPGWWIVSHPWKENKPSPPPLTLAEFDRIPNAGWVSWIYVHRNDMATVCRQLGQSVVDSGK